MSLMFTVNMEKIHLVYFVYGVLIFCFISNCSSQEISCLKKTQSNGTISESQSRYEKLVSKCWILEVPDDSFVLIDIQSLNFNSYSCSDIYLKISIAGKNENYTYCYQDTNRKPLTALNDVNITYYRMYGSSSFTLQYTRENLLCAQKNSFRCSSSLCIHHYEVCNGVKNCPNGADEIGCDKGIAAVTGMNVSRNSLLNWLKNQRSASFGLGKNTPRAITALYLAQAALFQSDSLDEELMAKQLELQTSVALLRNSTDPISVSELSMFINALTVTCHNPRSFYGYDLVQILSERTTFLASPSPSAYLTLCSSNWTVSDTNVKSLLKLLHKHSKYPFHSDVQAVAVMALTCLKNKSRIFNYTIHSTGSYDAAIKKFVAGQLADGSFGNIYTTALITQALISSGQEKNKQWNMTSTAHYLMKEMNSSSVAFLSAYLVLPIFSGKSLVDLMTVRCSNKTRKEGEDDEIADVTNKFGGKMRIQYSLFIGDQKDVIHTMFLRMPENSSAYDVMRLAQVADQKYKFLHRDVSGQMYVYDLAGITNDPEAGKFWLLYTGDNNINGTVKHHTESPDNFILKDLDHLIMWYRTAHI